MCNMETADVGRIQCSSLDMKLLKRLQVIDCLLSLFVFTPLCVFYWRGTYQLADIYIVPSRPVLSATLSTVLGCALQVCMSSAQRPLARIVKPQSGWVRFMITRGYTAIYAVGLVNHWRGAWALVDLLTTTSLWSSCASTLVGGIALVALRSLSNVIAPPLAVSLDLPEDYFVAQTFFKSHTCGGRIPKTVGLAGDDVFSIVVIGTLGIFFWRGVWTVMDTHFLTWNQIISAVASVGVGYFITVVVLAFQRTASAIAAQLYTSQRILLKHLFDDLFILLASVGAIFAWRGIWILLNELFLTDNYELSNWVCHVVGLLGLIIVYNSNTLLSRGVYIDGDTPSGQGGCMFTIDYLAILYKVNSMNSSSEKHVPQPIPSIITEANPIINEDNTIPFIDDEKLSNSYKEGLC